MLRIPTTASNQAEWTRKAATTLNRSLTGLGSAQSDILTAQSNITALQTAVVSTPVTKTTNFTVADSERNIICNGAASITVTLPDATTTAGRAIYIKTIAAFTVVSASSNVVPLTSATAGTAILAATAGKWARLVSDGVNWIIMAGA